MTKDARDIWRDVFPTKPISVGVHSAIVRLTTSNNVALTDELIFEVERSAQEPTRRWALDLDGPIQSSPQLLGDTLYVSALDGHCYALSTERGKALELSHKGSQTALLSSRKTRSTLDLTITFCMPLMPKPAKSA